MNPPFANEITKQKAETTAYHLIRCAPVEAWPTIWQVWLADDDFAHSFMSKLAYRSRDASSLQNLSTEQLKDLYLWLEQHYPRAEDPQIDGYHTVSSREEISSFRYQVFRHLQFKASPEAVATLQDIMTRFPDQEWMKWELSEAEHLARRASWTAPNIEMLEALIGNANRRLVRDSKELQQIILESLDRLQQELKYQETPAIRDLWDKVVKDKFRPISEEEVSDYIKRHLKKDIGDRELIITREAELRRKMSIEKGQRTDISVSVPVKEIGTDRHNTIVVVIEVKGCWHPELAKAMKTQLKDRYLTQNGYQHGIYLIAAFQSESWDMQDSRKKDCRIAFKELQQRYEQQAKELSDPVIHLEAFVLDLSF